jgi:hypothetical protein
VLDPAGTHTWCTTAVCTIGTLSGHCSVTSCGITCCLARTNCARWVLSAVCQNTKAILASLATLSGKTGMLLLASAALQASSRSLVQLPTCSTEFHISASLCNAQRTASMAEERSRFSVGSRVCCCCNQLCCNQGNTIPHLLLLLPRFTRPLRRQTASLHGVCGTSSPWHCARGVRRASLMMWPRRLQKRWSLQRQQTCSSSG